MFRYDYIYDNDEIRLIPVFSPSDLREPKPFSTNLFTPTFQVINQNFIPNSQIDFAKHYNNSFVEARRLKKRQEEKCVIIV